VNPYVLIKATKLVNGGLNSLEDRRKYLQKSKIALAGRVALNEGGNSTVLRRGSFGDAVIKLQELLITKGFLITYESQPL
jgi:putative chitinase